MILVTAALISHLGHRVWACVGTGRAKTRQQSVQARGPDKMNQEVETEHLVLLRGPRQFHHGATQGTWKSTNTLIKPVMQTLGTCG